MRTGLCRMSKDDCRAGFFTFQWWEERRRRKERRLRGSIARLLQADLRQQLPQSACLSEASLVRIAANQRAGMAGNAACYEERLPSGSVKSRRMCLCVRPVTPGEKMFCCFGRRQH